jgi:bla regulator protein blaR1
MLRSVDMMELGIFSIFTRWCCGLPGSATYWRIHIEGILAHESVHVRRHDNLTAAIYMLVEVVFWFHPLVWWIERRDTSGRELAGERWACLGGEGGECRA